MPGVCQPLGHREHLVEDGLEARGDHAVTLPATSGGPGRHESPTPTMRSVAPRSPSQVPADAAQADDILAVIAHSLMGSVSVIVGGTELLTSHWGELPQEERLELLVTMRGQARHVADVLDNLVRLGDPSLIEALDGLQHPADTRRTGGA